MANESVPMHVMWEAAAAINAALPHPWEAKVLQRAKSDRIGSYYWVEVAERDEKERVISFEVRFSCRRDVISYEVWSHWHHSSDDELVNDTLEDVLSYVIELALAKSVPRHLQGDWNECR